MKYMYLFDAKSYFFFENHFAPLFLREASIGNGIILDFFGAAPCSPPEPPKNKRRRSQPLVNDATVTVN